MTVNYHTHTYRCLHASGTDEEYICRAIERGVTELGFSDHIPLPPYDEDLSKTRMRYHEIPEYFEALLSLKEKYRNDIILRIGFEAEYVPSYFEKMLPILLEYPLDYLLLGQHWVGEERGEYIHIFKPQNDPATLDRYVDIVKRAVATGAFTYLAHPDYFHWTGDPLLYEERMEELCRHLAALNFPIELNLCGIHEGRHYPTPRFWQIAARAGCTVTLGCDAHSPERVCAPDEILEAHRFADRYHLNLVDRVPLVNPRNILKANSK